MLTGQQAQHRAQDPNGALLATAYPGGRDEQRVALRQALAGADDLDLVRVVAGAGRDAVTTVTADEADYLARELARRRDWAWLWQLALDLPLAGAITAASRFGDGWQPADEDGRALLRRLATGSARDPADPAAARLILCPLALMTPTDLTAVTEVLRRQPSDSLELLAACLEYRFGGEIALGDAQQPSTRARPDDVALA